MKLTRTLSCLVFALSAIGFVVLEGCSDSPTNTTPTTSDSLTVKSGTQYTYEQEKLDTTGGTSGGQDQPIASTSDTLTATTVATGLTQFNKTNVFETIEQHSRDNSFDTVYMYQDSGKLYRYNYGVEALNNNASVTNFLGSSIQLGWVEQIELSGKTGDTWTTNASVHLNGATVPIVITSRQMNDTTIIVNGESYAVKHAQHTISVNALIASASGLVDTYVSLKYGTVMNFVHSSSATIGASVIQSPGQRTVLLSHP